MPVFPDVKPIVHAEQKEWWFGLFLAEYLAVQVLGLINSFFHIISEILILFHEDKVR